MAPQALVLLKELEGVFYFPDDEQEKASPGGALSAPAPTDSEALRESALDHLNATRRDRRNSNDVSELHSEALAGRARNRRPPGKGRRRFLA